MKRANELDHPVTRIEMPQLSDDDYARFRDMIVERSGMLMGLRRRDALSRSVLASAERANRDLAAYYQLLQGTRTNSEWWDDLIGAITVGETYFFRDQAQFDALRQHILPELIARHGNDRRLRIWSAGCATGEEPYSLAILLHQLLPNLAQWRISILATDIDKQALLQAAQGRYREWSFRATDPAARQRYFVQRDTDLELIPQVRSMVTFTYLNLAQDVYPSLDTLTNAMDLILFRNVAIYLPETLVSMIAGRLYQSLAVEGWLLVGGAEASATTYSQFAVRNLYNAIAYQKAAKLPAAAGQAAGRPGIQLSPERVPGRMEEMDRPPPAQPLQPGRAPVKPPEAEERAAQSANGSYQAGLALFEQKRCEEAAACFLACLERDPGFAPAYYQMARCYANQGRLGEARLWCERAIERDPLLTEAHYTLALIHQEEGALEPAIGHLKKALYLDAKYVLAHFSLANIYHQMNQRGEATRHRTQATRLAARLPPNQIVPGSDGLTAARLVAMIKATP